MKSMLAVAFMSAVAVATDSAGTLHTIVPGPQDAASGACNALETWQLGGIGGNWLAVGQPNTLNRDDRAVFRFDIRRYLTAGRVAKATLRLAADPQTRGETFRLEQYSNYVWGFVARLAGEVAKRHPDKFVGCFAYERYNRPPTRLAKLPPNVAVMIYKQRRMFALPAEEKRVLAEIAAWKEKAAAVYYWDYYIFDSWQPWRGLPVLYSKVIEKDFRWMQAHGIRGEFIEAEGEAGEGVMRMHRPATQHLNLYLTARLGWDPTLNVHDLLAEYYRLFYGPAETEMKEFWTLAETIRTEAGARSATAAEFQPENVFPPEALTKLADLLAQGRAKTPEESVYRKRIELNSKGAIWDERIGFGVEPGDAWNGTASVKTSIEPRRWRIRLTIPFADLGIPQPAPPLALRANVYRTRWASGFRESNAWSPTNEPDYSVSNHYGTLVLRGEPRPGAEPETREDKHR